MGKVIDKIGETVGEKVVEAQNWKLMRTLVEEY